MNYSELMVYVDDGVFELQDIRNGRDAVIHRNERVGTITWIKRRDGREDPLVEVDDPRVIRLMRQYG